MVQWLSQQTGYNYPTAGGKPTLQGELRYFPEQLSKYEKPEFKPFVWSHNSKNEILDAMLEIVSLWEYVVKEALHNYSDMYAQLRLPIGATLKATCLKHKEVFAVYDRVTDKWLIEKSDPAYDFCYNGHNFVDFKEATSKKGGNVLLLVGKFTKMMQEPNLVKATANVPSLLLQSTFSMPRVKLIVGVPGCGKTRYIIGHHRVGSLVLTSCTEAAEDIRQRMAKRKGGQASNYRHSYRTIDSYLLNSRGRYSQVWIDEALMEHPGKLFLVALFTGCHQMYLLGDPNQLGYINRTSATLQYDKSATFFKPNETLNISYRCPVDVMAILSKHYDYDGGTYSSSNVLCSLKCKDFTCLEDVPILENTKYLVFKQAEKKQMRDAGYKVSTVHEFQGKEAEHVVLVRMSRNIREELYESAPHMLVAMTRHRETLVYYTPVKDKLRKYMETPLTEEELRDHHKPLPSASHIYDNDDNIFIYCADVYNRLVLVWFEYAYIVRAVNDFGPLRRLYGWVTGNNQVSQVRYYCGAYIAAYATAVRTYGSIRVGECVERSRRVRYSCSAYIGAYATAVRAYSSSRIDGWVDRSRRVRYSCSAYITAYATAVQSYGSDARAMRPRTTASVITSVWGKVTAVGRNLRNWAYSYTETLSVRYTEHEY